jgi:hypothetical protein
VKKIFVIAMLFITGCSSAPDQKSVMATALVQAGTQVAQEEAIKQSAKATMIYQIGLTQTAQIPTVIPATATPEIQQIPHGVYFRVGGAGDKVTDNYTFGHCIKSIFRWQMVGDEFGSFDLVRADGTDSVSIGYGVGNKSGETLIPLRGGTYFFVVKGNNQWQIEGECQD